MKKRSIAVLAGTAALAVLLCACQSSQSTAAQASTASAAQTAEAKENASQDPAAIVRDIATIQAFTDEAVPEEDIQFIVEAGINAPSSMNSQPWHFSVVTSAEVLQQIAGDMGGGMPKGSRDAAPADGKVPEGAPEGFSADGKASEGAPEGFPADGKAPAAPAANTASGAKAGIADAPAVIIVSCKAGSELDAGLATQNMSAEAQLLGYGTKIISSPKMALNGQNQAEYRELLGIPEDMTAVCMLLIGTTDTVEFDAVTGATPRNDADTVVSFIK